MGNFLGTVVNFAIVAVVMFGLANLLHGHRKKREAKMAQGGELDHTDQLLTDIRNEMRGMRKDFCARQLEGGPGAG